MTSAQMLKKKTENQSIAAAVLRFKVGSANAASAASGGRASINARSDPPMPTQASRLTSTQPNGTEMCRCSRCLRQRQSVQNASGQAGQVNQTNSFSSAATCAREP